MDASVFEKTVKVVRGYHPAEILMAIGVVGFGVILTTGIEGDAYARTWALAVSGGLVVVGAVLRCVQDVILAQVAKAAYAESLAANAKALDHAEAGRKDLMGLLQKITFRDGPRE